MAGETVITVIGTGFALLISGVVVTESVFNIPGIGRLTVDAVLARDYPVIQAMILLTSGLYVAINLLIDLAYTLLDCLVDDYFDVTEHLIDKIEKSDRKLFSPDSKLTLAKAHTLRLEAGKLRRYMRRTNDSVIQLMRAPHPLIDNHTKVYFRDIADHCSQMLDTLDGARDTISSITDTYLNIQSNQLNLQMRLLTVITIIFMPLTLLSGIYGMNFDYMPELKYHYAYFILLGVMATIVIVLLIVFRKKRWL